MTTHRSAIVLADGEAPGRGVLDDAWPGWADGLELVVAADGGARHARALRLRIDAWIGDGDSIDARELAALEAAGTTLHRVPADKDQTDTELAVGLALDAGATSLAILGALGGPRLDHGLANLGMLGAARLRGVAAVLYDERGARITFLEAPDGAGGPVARTIRGHTGDLVSLLPVGGPAHGVTTAHLHYPLRGEALELGGTRGVSNVRTAPDAWLRLESGRLLVIETPATVGR